jgi:hypothetical protein
MPHGSSVGIDNVIELLNPVSLIVSSRGDRAGTHMSDAARYRAAFAVFGRGGGLNGSDVQTAITQLDASSLPRRSWRAKRFQPPGQ